MNMRFVTDELSDREINRTSMANLFGGTFEKPEDNQSRGDHVFGSYDFCDEVREEEKRVNQNDSQRGFVPVDQIGDRSDEFETGWVQDGLDEDGYPEMACFSIDLLAGPRANNLPKGMSLEQAIEKLLRVSPLYVVGMYEMAGARGRFDILNLLPRLVSRLVAEGVYSLQVFYHTRIGRLSAYRDLRGKAADELRVIGPEGGIACRILETMGGI